ncbi:MAG: hypothetical protein HFE31_06185 [Clostridia bacterium]|nr:hypothetical protein [Clostridia bacterium]
MQMITNTANVTDFSGAMPIITYSNAVVTLIRQEPTSQIYIHRPRCNCHCPFTAPNFCGCPCMPYCITCCHEEYNNCNCCACNCHRCPFD